MAGDPDSRRARRRHLPRRLRGAAGPLTVEVVGARTGAERAAAAGLGRWLARVVFREAAGLVTVALVSDARIRALNRRFRGRDRVTDVLAFPPGAGPVPPGLGRALGDIVIARGRARRQARAAGHDLRAELRTLALHGLLHLLGYDHERDRGEMARLERRLRRRGGLRESLLERAAPARAGRGREEIR
jgi:probable rRNA maturation factor